MTTEKILKNKTLDQLSSVSCGKEYFDLGKFDQAANCFRQAAKLGDVSALCWLATCFEGGLGVQKDPDKAFDLLTQAAPFDSEASFRLALWYSDGIHCPTNYQKAVFWCAKAAKLGHEEAQEYMLYLSGDDV